MENYRLQSLLHYQCYRLNCVSKTTKLRTLNYCFTVHHPNAYLLHKSSALIFAIFRCTIKSVTHAC